ALRFGFFADLLDLALVARHELADFGVDLARLFLRALGAPFALFEDAQERVEEERLQEDDERGEHRELGEERQIEVQRDGRGEDLGGEGVRAHVGLLWEGSRWARHLPRAGPCWKVLESGAAAAKDGRSPAREKPRASRRLRPSLRCGDAEKSRS